MVSVSAIVLVASAQIAPTSPSRYLVHDGAAYVASPVYAVKSVTTNERFYWSHDGSRLAIVSDSATDPPVSQALRLARGEMPYGATRLSVWSRDSGRARDVFTTSDPTMGFDKVAFAGRALLFTTFSKTAPIRLWIAPENGNPRPVPLEGLTGGARFLSSRRGSVLVSDGDGLWLLTATQTGRLPVAKGHSVSLQGMTLDGRALVRDSGDGKVTYHLVDFATGARIPVAEPPLLASGTNLCPFILDAYQFSGAKRRLISGGDDAGKVDGNMATISDEDGGYRLDLVERVGATRRRMPFLNETARTVEVAPDGLSFAFVSNGVLMVRYLVRCDATATKRLVGG